MDKVFFTREVETHPLIRNNPAVFDQLMDTRLYHMTSATPERGQLVPRHNSEVHQVGKSFFFTKYRLIFQSFGFTLT